ncbi:shikimate dehydrogenase [Caldithrix abyssi]
MQRFAIIGHPLKHSFSPLIHNRAFADLNMDAHYEKIEIAPEEFEREVERLKNSDIVGFNITIPYKERIIPFVDQLSAEAVKIGALNTVKKVGDQWHGFNTDWIGFLRPLEKFSSSIKRCLLLGAGGAARGVFFALLRLPELQHIVISNRTRRRAEELVNQFRPFGQKTIYVSGFEYLLNMNERFDLIVNTTSVGMSGHNQTILLEPERVAHSKTVVYDLIYNPLKTILLKRAEERGLTTINGLPMLIYQAEEAFKIWTGRGFAEKTRTYLFDELPGLIE